VQRTFAKFHMDVGIGDVVLDPPVSMIRRVQQFAEKLHAYSLPRGGANSRGRDLGAFGATDPVGNTERACVCLEAPRCTFERRGTQDLSALQEPPPATWEKPIQGLAEEGLLDPVREQSIRRS
jgi:hypothetical protein